MKRGHFHDEVAGWGRTWPEIQVASNEAALRYMHMDDSLAIQFHGGDARAPGVRVHAGFPARLIVGPDHHCR